MSDRYEELTHDKFVEILEEIVGGKSAGALLQVPGAWEVFSEYYNNDVLKRWDEQHADD